MAIQFERNALYEEVWVTPLTKLGQKYGMSDNGIRKVCKTLNIPLPQAGHWAKVAAGQQIARKPLPPHSKQSTFVSHPPEHKSGDGMLDAEKEWLQEHEQYEKETQNQITVELEPEKLHPLLTNLPAIYKKLEQELEHAKRAAEKPPPKLSGRWQPNYAALKWSSYEHQGLLLLLPGKSLPFRFSSGTWKRGITVASGLLYAAETRGFKIIKSNDSPEIYLEMFEARVSVSLSEKLKDDCRQVKNPSELEILLGPRRYKVPSGILRLHLNTLGRYSEVLITETEISPLEQTLNTAFIKIYRLIVKHRIWHRELEERKRQEEARRIKNEELERARLQSLREQALEEERKEELIKEADDWYKASKLYQYIDHINKLLPHEGPADNVSFEAWKRWALKVAEAIDPTSSRLQQLSKTDSLNE